MYSFGPQIAKQVLKLSTSNKIATVSPNLQMTLNASH